MSFLSLLLLVHYFLLGLLPSLDFALLLSKESLILFSESKSLHSFIFISRSGQLLLPPLLNIILINMRDGHISSNVNFHCLQVDNNEV